MKANQPQNHPLRSCMVPRMPWNSGSGFQNRNPSPSRDSLRQRLQGALCNHKTKEYEVIVGSLNLGPEGPALVILALGPLGQILLPPPVAKAVPKHH